MGSIDTKKGAYLTPLLLIGLFLLANGSKSGKAIAPVKGKISDKFGGKRKHNGVDIVVPVGTPVKSPLDGTILNIYTSDAGGKQVLIKHTNGFTTGYAHLSKAIATIGEKVTKGEIFALSGNTGSDTTGAHLHFTIKDKSGNYLDPQQVIAKL